MFEAWHQNLKLNPAAVIPVEDVDDDDNDDDDGYVTAHEYLVFDAEEDVKILASSHESKLRKNPSHLSSLDQCNLVCITEPLKLERIGSGKKKSNKGIVSTGIELLSGLRPGSDVSKLQLPPQFNMPKSQLQVYGEAVYCCAQDFLGMCADGTNPMERMLAVVRFHLSTTRPSPFAKAPYNPILGEVHHVSVGNLNVLCEQVSHHPPVTALYATNDVKKLEMLWWHQPVPRFYGGYVEASILGRRRLKLVKHQETYEFNSPNLQIRFLPTAGNEWVGATTITCKESGLEALVHFKSKGLFGIRGSSHKVTGKIFQRSSGTILHELSGFWDGVVHFTDKITRTTSTLYDAQAAIVDIHAPSVVTVEAVSPMESVHVWREVTTNILKGDWERAREAKRKVEDTQRALNKQRVASNTEWSPKWFKAIQDGGWEWRCNQDSVSPAPLVIY